MSGCFGGKKDGTAVAVHPRYVPGRGLVLRHVLGALFGCFRPAKTRPLPRSGECRRCFDSTGHRPMKGGKGDSPLSEDSKGSERPKMKPRC